jgi:hypothetical protein
MKGKIKKILSLFLCDVTDLDFQDITKVNEVYAEQIVALCEAECQKRIKELIERIEGYKTYDEQYVGDYAIEVPLSEWQAIKKEYLGEGVDVS